MRIYIDKEHVATREIEDGFYTVVRDDETLFIFRINTHETDAKKRPGQQVIAKGKGPYSRTFYNFGVIQDGHLYQYARWKDAALNTAIVDAANSLLDGDMEEAGKMYARTTNRCYICNRKLTVADSLATGIGPDCAGNRKRKELEPNEQ